MFRLVAVVLVLTLVSCKTYESPSGPAPVTLPDFAYELYLNTATENVYQVDSLVSYADILVRRGGKLARFGHDHVISARNIYGYLLIVLKNPVGSRADLRLDLKSLAVDDQLARKTFELDTEPSQNDIQNTAENMQVKVLESNTWPQTHLQLTITGGTMDALAAQLTITLHGQKLALPIVIRIDEFTEDRLLASGTFDLMQSAFGIEPFSVLGGGLQVEDTVKVSYHLVANRFLSHAKKEE